MILPRSIAVRVADVEPLSPTLKRFRLEPVDGRPLPVAAPGSHVVLALRATSRPYKNAYSVVSGAEQRDAYEIVVRRTAHSRGGSIFLHEAVKPGDEIAIEPPNNLFPIASLARKHLLIGGGIGLTPLMSYLPELRARGAAFELHQFASADEAAVFERLLAPFATDRVQVHAGRAARPLAAILAGQPLGAHLYVCGPPALMDGVVAAARAAGWPAGKIHRESFGEARGGAPFTARLARSGVDIPVAADETLLEALEQGGVVTPSMCRGGACGECRLDVLDGEPEHRDDFLSAEEKASGRYVMPCVSRARTPCLTLDL